MPFEVGVTFTVNTETALTGALRSLKALKLDAPTSEAAEHYATLIVKALEQAADES